VAEEEINGVAEEELGGAGVLELARIIGADFFNVVISY